MALTKSGLSAFADKSEAMPTRSRIARAFEFLPLGEDDPFDDPFEFFISIPLLQLIPRFEFEKPIILVEPLTFYFPLELQDPTTPLSSPVGVGQDPGGLVGVIIRRHLSGSR